MSKMMVKDKGAGHMKTNRLFAAIGLLALLAAAALSAFTVTGALDIIGRWSVPAFEAILEAMPENLSEEPVYGGWGINVQGSSAKFIFRSATAVKEGYDLAFVLDAAPFIAAGADIARLAGASISEGKIYLGTDLTDAINGSEASGPVDVYRAILSANRSGIKYHAEMGHFGISLGGGNMFEWAKDPGSNRLDVVFVLNPEPFKEAGADINSIEGWALAKVTVMDELGRMVPVDRLVKAADLI